MAKESSALLPFPTSPSPPLFKKRANVFMVVFIAVATFFTFTSISPQASHIRQILTQKGRLESCSWHSLQSKVFLLDVPSISRSEFLHRQSVLAAALDEADVDAFIAEPSASSQYFANISSSYSLSERPFLMIIDRHGNFSYLVPKFEALRIAGLEMVFEEKKVIEWAEQESPYEVLKRETGFKKIMLDEHVRFMIASGLQASGVEVLPASQTIQEMRAVKSEAELKILRGINEYTIELVRSLQSCIHVGISQHDLTTVASSLFQKAGIGADFWAIALFGDQAANPHGGGKGRNLQDGEFVLLDIGSNLHGYGSDVTRTFLPAKSTVNNELMDIWYLVHDAQTAAIERMQINETCSVVDETSREVIKKAGYGDFFTHRLGHGLGLEMHEHPYLNGANDEKLKAGEVVTNEPGIYVTTEQAKTLGKDVGFGVRIEDAVLVTTNGGIVMTGSRAKSPWQP